MGTIYDVGQELGSSDCGYFAGMALQRLHKLAGWNRFDRATVYAAREEFTGHANKSSRSYEKRSNLYLHPKMAPSYLTFLGIDHYERSPDKARTPSQVESLIARGLADGRKGVMVAIGSGMSGHWVMVFPVHGNRHRSHWNIYDPADMLGGKTTTVSCLSRGAVSSWIADSVFNSIVQSAVGASLRPN